MSEFLDTIMFWVSLFTWDFDFPSTPRAPDLVVGGCVALLCLLNPGVSVRGVHVSTCLAGRN